jgi:hypothetical protein
LFTAGQRVLPDLFPHFIPTQITPTELLQLIEDSLTGLSPKFLDTELGIITVDGGQYVTTCGGLVPKRVQDYIEKEGGIGGTSLLAYLGGPPYGYSAAVVKACVAGLLRAGKAKIQPEGGAEITARRDAGVRDLFDKDRGFRRATIYPVTSDATVGPQARNKICKVFDQRLGLKLEREDHAIADAVAQQLPRVAAQLRDVQTRLSRLPGAPAMPDVLTKLERALEPCLQKIRQTAPTVVAVAKHIDALNDGLPVLGVWRLRLPMVKPAGRGGPPLPLPCPVPSPSASSCRPSAAGAAAQRARFNESNCSVLTASSAAPATLPPPAAVNCPISSSLNTDHW